MFSTKQMGMHLMSAIKSQAILQEVELERQRQFVQLDNARLGELMARCGNSLSLILSMHGSNILFMSSMIH